MFNNVVNVLRRLKHRLTRGIRRAPRTLNLGLQNIPGFDTVTSLWESEGGRLAMAKVCTHD